jgi:hypothetical protein
VALANYTLAFALQFRKSMENLSVVGKLILKRSGKSEDRGKTGCQLERSNDETLYMSRGSPLSGNH